MTGIVFLFGLLLGILGIWLWHTAKERSIKLAWVDYLLIAIFVLMAGGGIWFVNTFTEESVASAARSSGLIFGLLALLVLGVTWQLIRRRNHKSGI
jgi:MYXO-CTERM domain-containing protein